MNTALRWTLSVMAVCSSSTAAVNQILLRNLSSADGQLATLVADRSGHLFAVSLLAGESGATRVVEMDLNGSQLATLDVPKMPFARAAAMDPQGNLILAGSATNNLSDGMVLKLDPRSWNVLFSKSLPGFIQAITVDASGNIFLTGGTSSAAFPVSAGAYQTAPPASDTFGVSTYAFVTEISPSGDLLYSTYFGREGSYCVGGSSCVGSQHSNTAGTSIATAPSGGLIIAGYTNAGGLPTTAGAVSRACECGYRIGVAGFVARFQPAAPEQLQWSTFLNANPHGLTGSSVSVNSLDLDAEEDVILGGSAPFGLPTTNDTIQPSVPELDGRHGFLVKLNRSGTAVIWGTYFGDRSSSVNAFQVDTQGRVLFTGFGPSAEHLFRNTGYVARLSSDGARLDDYYEGPVGRGLAVTSTGGFAAASGALWIETTNPGPSLLSITNSASGTYASLVAGVELVTLLGIGIGPETPINGQVENGIYTSTLGGCQVLFDGVAAPLLYADSGHIKAVVPRRFGAPTGFTHATDFIHIEVATPSGLIDGPMVPVSYQTTPGIFSDSDTGLAAALNQDGSVNSRSNPAKPGSVVSVYVTGIGSARVHPDGAVVPDGTFNWVGPVWAVTNNRSLEVDFAGDAAGMVAGVVRVDFRLPDALPPGSTFGFNLIFSTVVSDSLTAGPSYVAIAH